jgi:hypothetical protein
MSQGMRRFFSSGLAGFPHMRLRSIPGIRLIISEHGPCFHEKP